MKKRLDPDIDSMGKEFEEDLKHFREDTRIRRSRRSDGFQKYRRTALIIGIGIVFLVVSMGYISGGTNDVGVADISTISAKLGEMEQGLASLESRVKKLEQSKARTKGAVGKEAKGNRYHEVQQGDTLSAIAQKYGITIDVLCLLNGITPQAIIRTGQMLLVTPGG